MEIFTALAPMANPRAVASCRVSEKRGLKYCSGYQSEVCAFGPHGRRAQPNGPSKCLFCDVDRLNASFLDGQGETLAIFFF